MKYLLLYFLIAVLVFFGYRLYLKIKFMFLLAEFFDEYKSVVNSYNIFFGFVSSESNVSDDVLESYEISRKDFEGVRIGISKIVLQNIKEEAEALLDMYEKNFEHLKVYELDFRAKNLREITVNIRRWCWINK